MNPRSLVLVSISATALALPACAGLSRGLQVSTGGAAAPAPASAPVATSAATAAPGQTYFDGAYMRTAPDASAAWQDQPETDAHRDDHGAVQPPGPSPISRTPATCDAAHNHCLHGNTWFVADLDAPIDRVELAYQFEGEFYAWSDEEHLTGFAGYHAYRTAPATAATAIPGALIAIYTGDPVGSLPDGAGHARDHGYWRLGTVGAVDAQAGTFTFAKRATAYPLAIARVVTATQPMK